MVLLVSTTQALFALDPDTRDLVEIDRGRGVYYGIAYTGDRVYVAARKWPYGAYPRERARQRGVIIEYDGALDEIRELEPPFPLRDLHQIHHAHGRLWVCCSFDDMVATWDGRSWDRWFPAGPPEPFETPHGASTDHHHFNSLWSDAEHVHVLANKKGTGTIHAFRAGDLAPVSATDLGQGAHNVWGEGGDLFTLSSKDGRLLSTGGVDLPFEHFVRGVVCPPAHTGLPRFLGLSSRATRHERARTDCLIARTDARWAEQERLRIAGEGMVHDLRAPGVPDLAFPAHLGTPLEIDALARARPVRRIEVADGVSAL